MADTKKEKIRTSLDEILKQNPKGLRYKDLLSAVQQREPDITKNTIVGSIHKIGLSDDRPFILPSRGFYRHKNVSDEQADQVVAEEIRLKGITEEDLYKPFARWLVEDVSDCTDAMPLGKAAMGKKWGTPDVVGVLRPASRDAIKYLPEVVTAEIKLEPSELVTAFGQAVAYRLFSNRVYIAVPTEAAEDDKARLEALCMLFGIGLVLFPLDANMDDIDFQLRVRATRHEVDFSFQNEFLNTLDSRKPDVFKKLFG